MLDTARAVATLDVLAALADTAAACNFTKPFVHEGDEFHRPSMSRHPSSSATSRRLRAERRLARWRRRRQLMILTGPNMGGKSTYLRQVALLALLAQAGSFVPAGTPSSRSSIASSRASARPTTSRAASRRSWSRCRRRRRSCTRRPSRSLVILDEIGRGTATFDGLSLAWAVAEHLAIERPRAAEDHLRDALSRAHRSRRRAAGVVNCHVAAREFRERHRLPAQDRRRADRTAATASRSRGWPACRPRSCGAPPRFSGRSSRTSSSAAAGRA